MEKENHRICYCAGRAECHNCYQPFGEYGETLSEEKVSELEEMYCPTYGE